MTLWTVARQASLFMGFSRQEYWSGLPFPSSGDLSHPGFEPRSPALQADALSSESPGKPKVRKLGVRINFPIVEHTSSFRLLSRNCSTHCGQIKT